MFLAVNDGYIATLNKPRDWSSFDVVKKVRAITRIRKVGHAGTLDPFATGVLLILIGKATKQMDNLLKLQKEYVALLRFGVETDTLDATGKIVKEESVPLLDVNMIRDAVKKFTGEIVQKVPDYSAAKIQGRRMYKLARQGKDVPPRFKKVNIKDIKIMSLRENELLFRVKCGSGTYIRTLGADIARYLGTVGYLQELTRTAIGEFTLEKATEVENFHKKWVELSANESFS